MFPPLALPSSNDYATERELPEERRIAVFENIREALPIATDSTDSAYRRSCQQEGGASYHQSQHEALETSSAPSSSLPVTHQEEDQSFDRATQQCN
jgi:hypothetical protein